MDDLDNKIKNILSEDIEVSYKYQNMIINTLKERKKNKNVFIKKGFKLITATCACVIVTTSIVFAKDISNWVKGIFNNNSKGIDTAIENGYILQPDMEYINSNGTEVKIDNLIMDDFNLSFTVNLKFKDEISVNEISSVYLPDMIIIDNENKIIYCQDKNTFDQYCNENELSLKYKEFNDYNINSGSNWFIKVKNLQDNSVDLVYNLYANNFPKSKEINLLFKQIEIEKGENSENKTIIKGDWKLNIEIPEEFYNREAIVYKVKNCSNPKINVTEAIVYNTCMKFTLTTQEELIYDPEDSEDVINQKISQKVDETREEYLKNVREGNYDKLHSFTSNPYVQTSNGEKFYPTKNSSEDSGISNDYMTGLVRYWQTFNLTKYDASQNLKIFLNYKGEDIIIELERKN